MYQVLFVGPLLVPRTYVYLVPICCKVFLKEKRIPSLNLCTLVSGAAPRFPSLMLAGS